MIHFHVVCIKPNSKFNTKLLWTFVNQGYITETKNTFNLLQIHLLDGLTEIYRVSPSPRIYWVRSTPSFFSSKNYTISAFIVQYNVHIWNQQVKCIEMSTNKFIFGAVVLEIALFYIKLGIFPLKHIGYFSIKNINFAVLYNKIWKKKSVFLLAVSLSQI